MKVLSPSERLAKNTGRLEGRAQVITGLTQLPTEVHVRTVEVLTELMGMGEKLSGSSTPPYLRAAMRALVKAKPFILENISDVPPHLIQQWMTDLQSRIQPILDVTLTPPAAVEEGSQDGAAVETRKDLAPAT